MISFKGKHFPKDIILMAIRWYCTYALSYREIEELMLERGVLVDHATLNRWVGEYASLLLNKFKRKKINENWKIDETYLKVKGRWHYQYRAVDKFGKTVDFLLSKKRDKKSAILFFKKGIKFNGTPVKANLDKNPANTAGLEEINRELKTKEQIIIRKVLIIWLSKITDLLKRLRSQ